MKKLKLYLSKSNNCDIDKFNKDKEILSKYFEIYVWSHNLINSPLFKEMDLILMYPPKGYSNSSIDLQAVIIAGCKL